jgi:hypothetical protein
MFDLQQRQGFLLPKTSKPGTHPVFYPMGTTGILLSTDPPLVRDMLIFSDPPHNPPKLSFKANGHTKSQGAVLPNGMKKGKNLERLITATSQARI